MSNRTVVIRFPEAPEPAVEGGLGGPTSEAVAMVRFLVARLNDDPDQMRAARLRSLVASWLDGTQRSPESLVQVEGWHRGFQDGLLMALMVEASTYDAHPDWREEWAS